jgi:hypothetical protein
MAASKESPSGNNTLSADNALSDGGVINLENNLTDEQAEE